jgi:hypothetical protein
MIQQDGDIRMKTLKLIAAATLAAGLIASPAVAKSKMKHRAQTNQDYTEQMNDDGFNSMGNQNGGYRNTGFWPGDVAAGAVGGAIGVAGAAVNTAGAIATAPFRSWENSYAYDNGSANGFTGYVGDEYAQGGEPFICQPGTWIRGADGRRHICQ